MRMIDGTRNLILYAMMNAHDDAYTKAESERILDDLACEYGSEFISYLIDSDEIRELSEILKTIDVNDIKKFYKKYYIK